MSVPWGTRNPRSRAKHHHALRAFESAQGTRGKAPRFGEATRRACFGGLSLDFIETPSINYDTTDRFL